MSPHATRWVGDRRRSGEQRGAEGRRGLPLRASLRKRAQSHYIKASNTDPEDSLGAGVAWAGQQLTVDAYGEDRCATRENGDQFDDRCFGTGAVHVFE